MTDRGQSEVIGFVLVFVLVVSTVSLASVAGFAGLQDARDYERSQNAERAIEAFAIGVDEVAHEGAPSRRIELSADDAQVYAGESVAVTVTVADGESTTLDVRPLVYRGPDGSRLIYVAGAVIRSGDDGAVMLREPDILLGEDRTVIRLVQTRMPGGASVGGGSVGVRATAVDDRALLASESPRDLTIRIESPRAAVWERYFESQEGLDCTGTAEVVTCDVTTASAHVTVAEIRVDVS